MTHDEVYERLGILEARFGIRSEQIKALRANSDFRAAYHRGYLDTRIEMVKAALDKLNESFRELVAVSEMLNNYE